LLLAISIPAWSFAASTQVNTSFSASAVSVEAGTATNFFLHPIIVAAKTPYPLFPFSAGSRPGSLDLIVGYGDHQNNSFHSNLHSTATSCISTIDRAPSKGLLDRRFSIAANTDAGNTASVFSGRRISNFADRFHKAAKESL
jgi:hypothetical protein